MADVSTMNSLLFVNLYFGKLRGIMFDFSVMLPLQLLLALTLPMYGTVHHNKYKLHLGTLASVNFVT